MSQPFPAQGELDWHPEGRWQPERGAIDLWCFALTMAPEDPPLLCAEERARADRLVVPARRRQFVAGRATLRRILARYLQADPAALRFRFGEHGKPELDHPTPVAFNLSHSHELALLGVAAPEVTLGVDLEYRRPGRAFEAIAERFFSPEESEQLAATPAASRPAIFYRAWAQKEAYLKALGTGLSFSSSAFAVTMRADRPAALRWTRMPGDLPERWRFSDLPVPGDYAAAICWSGPALPLRCFVLPGRPPEGGWPARSPGPRGPAGTTRAR